MSLHYWSLTVPCPCFIHVSSTRANNKLILPKLLLLWYQAVHYMWQIRADLRRRKQIQPHGLRLGLTNTSTECSATGQDGSIQSAQKETNLSRSLSLSLSGSRELTVVTTTLPFPHTMDQAGVLNELCGFDLHKHNGHITYCLAGLSMAPMGGSCEGNRDK